MNEDRKSLKIRKVMDETPISLYILCVIATLLAIFSIVLAMIVIKY